MTKIWTAAAVLFLIPLAACNNDDDNDLEILPIRALFSAGAEPPGPAVFLRPSALDTSSVDDVAFVDVVLRSGGSPITFDAITLEIDFVDPATSALRPGIVQVAFDVSGGATPFGNCNTCIATSGCGGLVCAECSSCPAMDPPTGSVNTPLCFTNIGGTFTSGKLIMGVSSLPVSACASATATGDLLLLTLMVQAQSTGTVGLKFVTTPLSGDCEILAFAGPADLGVPCVDTGATFRATR